MVENLLLAAMRGNVNVIFREGDFRLQKENDGTFIARLSATGNEPSLQGSVGGAYFDAPSSITWTGLEEGQDYYLYIQGNNKTFYDAQNVVPIASVYRMKTKYVTLVAKANLRNVNPSLDLNPPGKVNARDIAQHVLDYDNPHGDKLIQDEVLIRKHLAIGEDNDADIDLEVNGVASHFPLSRLIDVLKTKNIFVDFTTDGMNGVTLTAPGKISFASVVRTDLTDQNSGDVVIGFYGLQNDVKSDNSIIVWNTSGKKIKMRAIIICES
jgi:hypothetical protein